MNDLPKRKQIRLKEYDYSQNGYYFITICTKDKKSIFWNCDINCRGGHWPPVNENGNIPKIYGGYNIDKYVIMPNHIHFILIIARGNGRPMTAPTDIGFKLDGSNLKLWDNTPITGENQIDLFT